MRVNTATLRYYCAALRKFCAPTLPVVVRRRRLPCDTPGYSALLKDADGKPAQFAIHVDHRLTAFELQTVLVHEWAHCMDWTEGSLDREDHPPSFWLKHGEAYAAMHAEEDG